MENNTLNGQPHYNGWDAFDKMQEVLGENPEFLLGNVVKYVYRYDKKGTPLQDLEKAKVYLEKRMSALEIPKTFHGGKPLPAEQTRQILFIHLSHFNNDGQTYHLALALSLLNELIKTKQC